MLFRCDANQVIGIGHVVRCLAIGKEMVKSGHEVSFFSDIEEQPFLLSLFAQNGFEILNPKKLEEFIEGNLRNCEMRLVLDLVGHWEDLVKIRKTKIKIMQFLNSLEQINSIDKFISAGIKPKWVSEDAFQEQQYFYGTEYLIFPQALVEAKRKVIESNDLVISLGGGNMDRFLREIIDFLVSQKVENKILIYSSTNQSKSIVEGSKLDIEFRQLSEEFYTAAAAAKKVICAAGTTIYQMLYLEKRTLMCKVVENQDSNFDFMLNSGFASGISVNFSNNIDELTIFRDFLTEKKNCKKVKFDDLGISRIIALVERI